MAVLLITTIAQLALIGCAEIARKSEVYPIYWCEVSSQHSLSRQGQSVAQAR